MTSLARPNLGPDPQDPDSELYQFIDQQELSKYPSNPDISPSHFTVKQFVPDNIINSFPIIVIKNNHGLTNGMRVRTTKFLVIPYSEATGMEQLNNRQFVVQKANENDFQLYDIEGLPVDGRSYTPYVQGGQFTVTKTYDSIVNPSRFPVL